MALLVCSLGVAAVFRKKKSIASWCLFLGMLTLAGEIVFSSIALRADQSAAAESWFIPARLAQSLFPLFWLGFSLTYSRGEPIRFLKRWRFLVIGAVVLPIVVAIGLISKNLHVERIEAGWWQVLSPIGKAFSAFALFYTVFILVNLENTFRASVGTERWRIKYMVLGLACVFGTKIYTLSQALLYSGIDPAMHLVDTCGLFVGSLLMIVAYQRKGFAALDLYPSREVLAGSITVILAGTYLLAVGILAQIVQKIGGGHNLPAQALVILVGLSGLAAFLLSGRSSLQVKRFVSRHFRRPQHDSRQIWSHFTERTSGILDRTVLCREFAKLISETFSVLTVNILLLDEEKKNLSLAASTNEIEKRNSSIRLRDFTIKNPVPFDLESRAGEWTKDLRDYCPDQFANGGSRLVVPLTTDENVIGLAVLGDRVGGMAYRHEELELLQRIGGHIGTALLNRELGEKLTHSAQLEAFQTMSTFFAHDLKNAANHLTLMLGNLPRHFDNPEFREDALRSISGSVDHINKLVGRLNEFRTALEVEIEECDINELVTEVISDFEVIGPMKINREFESLPAIQADREKLRSVVTNLILNAREASDADVPCRIDLSTSRENGHAIIAVRDQGCGMSPEFIEQSLFRPFCSTKSKGIGIGMYQTKMIVEAHGGKIEVKSEVGKGTTFRIHLPLEEEKDKTERLYPVKSETVPC